MDYCFFGVCRSVELALGRVEEGGGLRYLGVEAAFECHGGALCLCFSCTNVCIVCVVSACISVG